MTRNPVLYGDAQARAFRLSGGTILPEEATRVYDFTEDPVVNQAWYPSLNDDQWFNMTDESSADSHWVYTTRTKVDSPTYAEIVVGADRYDDGTCGVDFCKENR